jgi:lipooligosaccharide transport system permease protein
MFLFSGTFFPLSILPEIVQVLAVVFLPLTQLVIVTRSLTLAMISPYFFYSLTWIAVVTLLFFIISLSLMRRRLIV